MKAIDFWEQLKFSRVYEEIILPHLREIDEFRYVRFDNEKQVQLDGVDYVYGLKPIRKNTVELKIRRPRANDFDDIGIEIWSSYDTVRGWGYTSTAQFIIYAKLEKTYTDFRKAYIIDTEKLREWLVLNEEDPQFRRLYFKNRKDGAEYTTVFLAVPVEELNGIVREISIQLSESEKEKIRKALPAVSGKSIPV